MFDGESALMRSRPTMNVPASVTCPDCGTHMAAIAVAPQRLSDGDEDVTYRCRRCRGELRITLKSGC
jgi:DNA-directed RNA polymerase subunit M/transcription elongation factor TFIIS